MKRKEKLDTKKTLPLKFMIHINMLYSILFAPFNTYFSSSKKRISNQNRTCICIQTTDRSTDLDKRMLCIHWYGISWNHKSYSKKLSRLSIGTSNRKHDKQSTFSNRLFSIENSEICTTATKASYNIANYRINILITVIHRSISLSHTHISNANTNCRAIHFYRVFNVIKMWEKRKTVVCKMCVMLCELSEWRSSVGVVRRNYNYTISYMHDFCYIIFRIEVNSRVILTCTFLCCSCFFFFVRSFVRYVCVCLKWQLNDCVLFFFFAKKREPTNLNISKTPKFTELHDYISIYSKYYKYIPDILMSMIEKNQKFLRFFFIKLPIYIYTYKRNKLY